MCVAANVRCAVGNSGDPRSLWIPIEVLTFKAGATLWIVLAIDRMGACLIVKPTFSIFLMVLGNSDLMVETGLDLIFSCVLGISLSYRGDLMSSNWMNSSWFASFWPMLGFRD